MLLSRKRGISSAPQSGRIKMIRPGRWTYIAVRTGVVCVVILWIGGVDEFKEMLSQIANLVEMVPSQPRHDQQDDSVKAIAPKKGNS